MRQRVFNWIVLIGVFVLMAVVTSGHTRPAQFTPQAELERSWSAFMGCMQTLGAQIAAGVEPLDEMGLYGRRLGESGVQLPADANRLIVSTTKFLAIYERRDDAATRLAKSTATLRAAIKRMHPSIDLDKIRACPD